MISRQFAVTVAFILVLAIIGISLFIFPDKDISVSERRFLTQYQTYDEQKELAEKRGEEFNPSKYFAFTEKYFLDQFPMRDTFRTIKALFKRHALGQKDNNGYYYADGTLSRMDSEMNIRVLQDSLNTINGIYEKYFINTASNAYYALIPDKNFFVAEKNGYLHYDYNLLYKEAREVLDDRIKELSVREILMTEDYYRTDTHWDQSGLIPVADILLTGMGAGKASAHTWTENKIEGFRGTYYGQAALPVKEDTLTYLTGDALENVTVYNHALKKTTGLYNENNFQNTDPYDVFLDGAVPLLTITNAGQKNKKQLIIFRDSFGSSIIPLLVPEYSELVVVDIRYIAPGLLENMIRIQKNSDVLFLYSTTILKTYGAFLR